jgi:hypothetical protein
MVRWEIFMALAAESDGGLCALWYWKRIDPDGETVTSNAGFSVLADCVADARRHGLADEPANLVR